MAFPHREGCLHQRGVELGELGPDFREARGAAEPPEVPGLPGGEEGLGGAGLGKGGVEGVVHRLPGAAKRGVGENLAGQAAILLRPGGRVVLHADSAIYGHITHDYTPLLHADRLASGSRR